MRIPRGLWSPMESPSAHKQHQQCTTTSHNQTHHCTVGWRVPPGLIIARKHAKMAPSGENGSTNSSPATRSGPCGSTRAKVDSKGTGGENVGPTKATSSTMWPTRGILATKVSRNQLGIAEEVVGHQPATSERALVACRSHWNLAVWVVGEWGE
jgi:hypothetical protein